MENNEIRIHPLLSSKELILIADMLLTKKCEITYEALRENYGISEISPKHMANKLLHTFIIQYSEDTMSKTPLFTKIYYDDNSIRFYFDKDVGNMEKLLIYLCFSSRSAIFDTYKVHSELNSRSGSKVEVIRELTKDECDTEDVGRMYHIRFADGFETDAFDDELYNIMEAKATIENGTKVYMIFHDCLCYVTVDYSSDDNPTTYHVENSEVFFTEDDIGKTVFFNEEDARREMKLSVKKFHFSASWAGEYTAESREFDVESDGDTPPWEKAVKTALQLAQQNHGALNMLEYMWTC